MLNKNTWTYCSNRTNSAKKVSVSIFTKGSILSYTVGTLPRLMLPLSHILGLQQEGLPFGGGDSEHRVLLVVVVSTHGQAVADGDSRAGVLQVQVSTTRLGREVW